MFLVWNLEGMFLISFATKTFLDFCYQSYTKNDISPRLTHYRKNSVLKKIIHLSVEKYLKKKYNYYVYRIWHTYRRVMVLQMSLCTLFNTICLFWDMTSQKRSIFGKFSKISKVWESISFFKQLAFNNALNKSCRSISPLNNI